MATIRKRNGKWHVQIRRKNLPSQTCSFVHKNHALKWIRDIEIKLEQQTLGMISTYPTFKSLIEEQKLLVFDEHIIHEISTFTEKGNTYQADEGYHDDLVMCLVLFGWLVNQRYFKELTNVDVRGQMFTEQQNAIEADMAPFGFIDDGLNDPEGNDNSFFDDAGVRWSPVTYRKGE